GASNAFDSARLHTSLSLSPSLSSQSPAPQLGVCSLALGASSLSCCCRGGVLACEDGRGRWRRRKGTALHCHTPTGSARRDLSADLVGQRRGGRTPKCRGSLIVRGAVDGGRGSPGGDPGRRGHLGSLGRGRRAPEGRPTTERLEALR